MKGEELSIKWGENSWGKILVDWTILEKLTGGRYLTCLGLKKVPDKKKKQNKAVVPFKNRGM